MNDTPDSRDHELKKVFLVAIFIFVSLTLIVGNLLTVARAHEKQIQEQKLTQAYEAGYTQGYDRALDCRSLLSAPACEIVLKEASK